MKLYRTHIYLAIILALSFSVSYSQISEGGTPYSFGKSLSSNIDIKQMPSVDVQALLAEDAIDESQGIPFRFGAPFDVHYDILNSGTWTDLPDGSGLWRLEIKSDGAYSINLIYDHFFIPPGAELFIYNEAHDIIFGAFTSKNNRDYDEFATAPVKGNVTILEYHEPAAARGSGYISISRVVHAYKDIFDFGGTTDKGFGNSGSCNNNINCPEGAPWQNEKRAGAMILLADGTRICSGSLVNNVRQDGTPYFLTANHCLIGDYTTWIFMFKYESPNCTNIDGPTNYTLQGAALRATNGYSDFSLLELDDDPPSSYNVYYAGWSNVDVASQNSTCIHHPRGDIKKISFDYDPVVSTDYLGTSGSTHWRIVDWDDGTTEPGSSGSPLYDPNHHIVGQLHGGYAACGNDDSDWYGKFAKSWNYGSTISTRLKDWLDPDNTGATTFDGFDPAAIPVADFSGTPTSGGAPLTVQFTDLSTNSPTSWSWNFGDNTTSTQQNPSHEYANLGNYTVTLTATNAAGSDYETKTDYISVVIPPPVAAFYAQPICGCAPLSVSFFDQSSGDIDEWWWNFGDGGKADPANPFYTYYNVGSYDVSLEVIGPGGSDLETKPNYIQVLSGPQASFTASPTSGDGPLTVDFVDLSTNALSWLWSFGDGTTSNEQNPTHIYTGYGDFSVTLQVGGLCGNHSHTEVAYIHVEMPGMTLFSPPVNYNNGGNAESVTADDFDNDGDIDLAVATYYPEYTAVYFNDGNGNFTPAGNYDCGDSPYFITSADFDNDGFIDLAVANPIKWNGGYVSVLYNYEGGFSYPDNFYTGAWYPYSIATGDFNDNGYTDMAVVQYDGNNIVLFYNNYGMFSTDTAIFPIVGYSPKSIVAGDFDGDNDLDLATANYANMSILLNDGTGSFSTSVEYPTGGSEGRYICSGDFDGDSDLDLAVASTTNDMLSVLFNNGDATFGTAVEYNIGDAPYAVAAADFDGDGTVDLVVANSYGSTASVLLNNGNGSFGEATEYNIGGGQNSVTTADFDNDNDYDLAFTKGYTTNNLAILFNNSDVLPAAPDLLIPTEGASTTDHTPHTDWSDVLGASSYDVILNDDEDFSSITRSKTGQLISEWDVSPSLGDGYYYVKARAVNSYGIGPWSEAHRFHVYTSSGNPSCPVLYTYDGDQYYQDNPLLTACEQSNYTEAVTDYYHVEQPVVAQDGKVKFQLREMEDEITYLQDVELITVDHSSASRMAVSVDGDIGLYSDIISPISAVDNNGIDRLSEIIREDGNFYSCDGAGSLVITFQNYGNSTATFGFSAKTKELCIQIKKENSNVPPAGFKIEIMDSDGNWIEGPTVPTRVNHAQEMITGEIPTSSDQAETKIRISWESGYYTDVVQQYVPSSETPVINELTVASHTMVDSPDPVKTSAAFDSPDPLVMNKGDIFEFSFDTPASAASGTTREYIIRAVGRYIPDYSKFKHLLPTEVQLYSNFPNPFNPSTTIQYYLPQKADVRLEIYNILGRRVKILVDGPAKAGMNSVIWNSTDDGGSQVASGIYFYRLTVGSKVESKRMLLVK